MAPAPALEFWFTMGSTYTYLTVMRLPGVERSSGRAASRSAGARSTCARSSKR
jgi:2-hydroxychromene-2-carboxylate isomerase